MCVCVCLCVYVCVCVWVCAYQQIGHSISWKVCLWHPINTIEESKCVQLSLCRWMLVHFLMFRFSPCATNAVATLILQCVEVETLIHPRAQDILMLWLKAVHSHLVVCLASLQRVPHCTEGAMQLKRWGWCPCSQWSHQYYFLLLAHPEMGAT